MYYLKMAYRFVLIYVKSEMEYRANFIISMILQMSSYCISLLSVWIMLRKFNTINGWSMYEVMFLSSLNLLTYSLASLLLWSPMREMEDLVCQGGFDGILTRPMHSFVFMFFRGFNHAFIGNTLVSATILYICLQHISVHWSFKMIFWSSLTLLGGVLIQAAIFIITGSINFWFMKSTAIVDTAVYSVRGFLDYPLSIYQRWVQVLLTFIIPYAFVNFYPARYFLDKKEDVLFHPVFSIATPIIGAGLMVLSYFIWNAGVNRYESSGS